MGFQAKPKKKKITDFKTVKRKLGKQYKAASHTDLSFQTRSIFMPTQSVSVEKNEYVNSRNLSLGDLLTQCRHYNESTRKEAVAGLKDLLLKYPVILERQLSTICDKLVELMLDSSGDVRMALHGLLDEILPLLSENLVSPFFPLFVAYISTGMTHINGAVRLDALQYATLWLYYHPELVAKFHSKLLPHYIMLMNTRDPPPKTLDNSANKIRRLQKEVKVTTAAKLHVPNALRMKAVLLSSLYDLLVAQLGDAYDSVYDTTLNPENDDDIIKYARKHLHLGNLNEAISNSVWTPTNSSVNVHVPNRPSYTLDEILDESEHFAGLGMTRIESTRKQNENLTPTEAKLHLDDPECFKYFFTVLIPLLLNQWLECDPDNLVPHSLRPLGYILKTWVLMLAHLDSLIPNDRESQYAKKLFLEEYLVGIKKFVFPKFPLDYQSSWTDEELSMVTHLNVLIAKLGSFFFNHENADEPWAKSIVDYTLYSFGGKIARPTGRRTSQKNEQEKTNESKKAAASLSTSDMNHFQIVSELLPVVRRITKYADEEDRIKLLKSFQAFNEACPAKSTSKRMCISFFADLLLNDDEEELESDSETENEDEMNQKMDVDNQHKKEKKSKKKESSKESSNEHQDNIGSETIENHDSNEEIEFKDEPICQMRPSKIPVDICNALLFTLPKTLWQLQSDHPTTSRLILGILCHYGAQVQYVPSRKPQFEKLQSALIPFFWTEIAKKSKKSSKSKNGEDAESGEPKKMEVYGPFIHLPVHVQRAAIEVLYHLKHLSPAMVESLVHCASSMRLNVDVVQYLLETIEYPRQFNGSLADYISFLLSLLVGVATKELETNMPTRSRLQRCFAISKILAKQATALQLGTQLLDIVEEHICGLLNQFLEDQSSDSSDLCSSLLVFMGTYLKLIYFDGLSSIPASLTEVVPKCIVKLLIQTAKINAGNHPDIIVIKDLCAMVPQLLSEVLKQLESRMREQKITDLEKVIVFDVMTRYRSDVRKSISGEGLTALEAIIELLKADGEDNLVRTIIGEYKLFKSE